MLLCFFPLKYITELQICSLMILRSQRPRVFSTKKCYFESGSYSHQSCCQSPAARLAVLHQSSITAIPPQIEVRENLPFFAELLRIVFSAVEVGGIFALISQDKAFLSSNGFQKFKNLLSEYIRCRHFRLHHRFEISNLKKKIMTLCL